MLLTAKAPLDVIAGIQIAATRAGLSDQEREPVARCVQYLSANMAAIAYPQFLARGLPLATGVIEGACRHLIQDRLGITGGAAPSEGRGRMWLLTKGAPASLGLLRPPGNIILLS